MQAIKTAPVDRPVFGRRDPDARGYFGAYGGRFVPETLVAPIEELTAGYYAARQDEAFCEELDRLLKHYVGRPTPLYEARNLARADEASGAGEAGRVGRVLSASAEATADSPKREARRRSQPRQPVRCSASNAASTWGPRTCVARR